MQVDTGAPKKIILLLRNRWSLIFEQEYTTHNDSNSVQNYLFDNFNKESKF